MTCMNTFYGNIKVDDNNILFKKMHHAFQSFNTNIKYHEYNGNDISYLDNPENNISDLQLEASRGADEVCNTISNAFKTVKSFNTSINFEEIIRLIKKKKKINISFVDNFNDYEESIDIQCSGFDIIYNNTFIPIEFFEIYSPTNNIYFIICECMKNIYYKNKNEDGYYNTYYSVCEEEINIVYKDKFGNYQNGYVEVCSNIDNPDVVNAFYCSGNKGWKCINYNDKYHHINAKNNFFDFKNRNKITFELKMFDCYKEQINTIKCLVQFKNNFSCVIHNENNIDIVNVSNIHHYPHINHNHSLENRIKFIKKNIISNDYFYLNYIKEERKQMIKAFQDYKYSISSYERNISKQNIINLNNTMRKYINIRSKYIKNKVYTIILCLKKNKITIPNEIWINILYFNNLKI